MIWSQELCEDDRTVAIETAALEDALKARVGSKGIPLHVDEEVDDGHVHTITPVRPEASSNRSSARSWR